MTRPIFLFLLAALLVACPTSYAAPAVEARLYPANVFLGDEDALGAGSPSLRDHYLAPCPVLPTSLDDLNSRSFDDPGVNACASLVTLNCGGGRLLTGFHLVRDAAFGGSGYRLYTAAHMINVFNRQYNASDTTQLFAFSACSMRLGVLSRRGLQARLSAPHFKGETGRAVQSQAYSHLVNAAGMTDLAWFDVTLPDDPVERAVLAKVALPIYRGKLAAVAGVCSAGHDGTPGEAVFRCLARGATRAADGTIKTRAPTIAGMSGGPLLAVLADGTYGAIGVISSEATARGAGPRVSVGGDSVILTATGANLNFAVSY